MHDKDFNHEPRGEFRGNFSRDTYDPFRHFSRVLMQQGRVQLDSDWNEQVSIFWHYLRGLAKDLGGEHWAPANGQTKGYKITSSNTKGLQDFQIGEGTYYVQGVRCENENSDLRYTTQYGYPFPDSEEIEVGKRYLVYLDVWERHLTYVEDDYTREVALNGPDTAARSKIVWQAKIKVIDEDVGGFKENYQKFLDELGSLKKPGRGQLRARAKKNKTENEKPCLVTPQANFRGTENQLYRVEIHKEGPAGTATFKWSRENGAVIFPIAAFGDTTVTLEHLGKNRPFDLKVNDWVEIVDDFYALRGKAEPLLQVEFIDHESLEVTLKNMQPLNSSGIMERHPYLRRWDHKTDLNDGDLSVVESKGEGIENWLLIENGVEIQFLEIDGGIEKPIYKTGDYWIIPARIATGDVQWPKEMNNISNELISKALHPHGVQHYYAPIDEMTVDGKGQIAKPKDIRRTLKKAWSK
ncbi:MAG: hypothetical protein HKM93_13015 [Desulfobacteraceae bacterium]|nr:hypothetical protein [Desulfobacteraceae bacterium]